MMKEVLEQIIKSEGPERERLIKEFQQQVWDREEGSSIPTSEILEQLAHDLDFYEPDENVRREDSSFYGDERLETEILDALERLKST